MVKKVFTLFLVSCFLLNTVSLNVLTADNQRITIPDRDIADLTNKEELMNTVNELLDILENLDPADQPYVNELMQRFFGDSSANEFRDIINRYLEEYLAYEINQNEGIAPGCLAPYSLAWIQLWILTPASLLYSLVAALRVDNNCSLMYASWGLTFLSLGFRTWTTYRICAEENSEVPDQDTIDKLEADRAVMSTATVVFSLIALSFAQYCEVSRYYGSYDDDD